MANRYSQTWLMKVIMKELMIIIVQSTVVKTFIMNGHVVVMPELAEEFDDANGNQKIDSDEKYTDSNGNGKWDDGEQFVDIGNGLGMKVKRLPIAIIELEI